MKKKLFIISFTSLILISCIASTTLSNPIFAQLSPSLNNNGSGLGLPHTLKNVFNHGINASKNLINQASNAINPFNLINQANDAIKNNPFNLINQANDAIKNNPFNLINQANDAIKNTISKSKNATMNQINQAAVKKLNSIFSLTNVVGISMVNGIKLNEIAIGDKNISAVLNYQPAQNNTGKNSLPVTVIVTKLPIANLTKLLYLAAESSKVASTLSSGSGSIDSLINQTKLTPVTLNIALQSLDLIKNLQSGVVSTTLSSLNNPQKISVQTPGGLGSSLSTAPNEFVTVLVVPSLGIGPFPSISLK